MQNNPVNYTDPSGHFWNSIKKGWNYVKSGLNWAGRQISRGVNWVGRQISRGVNWVGRQIDRGVNWVSTQFNRASNWVGRQWNKVQTAYNSAVDYVQTKYQQAQARIQELRYQAIRTAYAVTIGFKASPTIREGKNLLRNWNPALLNTLKHICDPKTTKGQDDAHKKKLTTSELQQLIKKANSGDMSAIATLSRSYDGKSGIGTDIRTKEEIAAGNRRVWQNTVDGFKKIPYIIGEFSSVNDTYRLTTGKDP